MHDTGTDSDSVLDCFKMINEKVEMFSSSIEDTPIILLENHSHINCNKIILSNYKDIFNTLAGDVWIECKIKDNRKEEVKKLFSKYFKEDFIKKTKEEIIDEKLIGDGIENKYFRDSP